MTEEKALVALRRDSEEALGWFIDRYNAYVCAVIYRMIGQKMSQDDVEETASDVYVAQWQSAERVKSASVKAWLGATAQHLALGKLREVSETLPLEDDLLVIERATPETALERKELRLAVRQAVLSMDWPDREIFLRHYFFEQPLAEIVESMGIGLSTIKSRLHRGREKLKAALGAEKNERGGVNSGRKNI